MRKVILGVIVRRKKWKIMGNVGENQNGFRKGKGTRKTIWDLRMILKKTIEMRKKIYLYYVNFQMTFDTVKQERMTGMLQDNAIDIKDLRIIRNLYWKKSDSASMRRTTERIHIKKGLRQGCSDMALVLYVCRTCHTKNSPYM